MDGLVALVPLEAAVGRQGGGDFSCDAMGRIGWDKGPDGLVYVGAQILKTDRIAAPSTGAVFAGRDWNDMMAKGA
jgi:MurNAc alpha-1-phosphate uridylyltransferase